MRKEEVNLNDLPMARGRKRSRGTEAHAVVLHSQVGAHDVEPVANFMTDSGIRVIEQPLHGVPHEPATDQRMFAATAKATSGSKGFHPVIITNTRPATTPKLVQLSVRTCSPSASRINE